MDIVGWDDVDSGRNFVCDDNLFSNSKFNLILQGLQMYSNKKIISWPAQKPS